MRTIFETYLQVGSIGALIPALREQGVRPKGRRLADGRIIAADEFMRGPLGHLLRNRCYVGEVAYRGEVHKGEHDADPRPGPVRRRPGQTFRTEGPAQHGADSIVASV